jgi:hypothetical protein
VEALAAKMYPCLNLYRGTSTLQAEMRQPALWILEHANVLLSVPETEGADPLPVAVMAAHILQLLEASKAAGHCVIPVFIW